jgi:hypothetical protein
MNALKFQSKGFDPAIGACQSDSFLRRLLRPIVVFCETGIEAEPFCFTRSAGELSGGILVCTVVGNVLIYKG